MRRKAKLVVLGTAAAAIAVLLLAALAGKDWFLEEWHLFQLEHGSREDVLAAAGWLGQKKCARAARPLLRAMRRASAEIDAPSDSARVARFVRGPSGITSESSPEKLPPPYEHLEFLRAFSRIGDPATPDLIRSLRDEEDELTHRLAGNILIRILCFRWVTWEGNDLGILVTPLEYHRPKLPGLGDVDHGSRSLPFGDWVRIRDYGVKDVWAHLEHVSNDAGFDPSVRRLAGEALEKHANR